MQPPKMANSRAQHGASAATAGVQNDTADFGEFCFAGIAMLLAVATATALLVRYVLKPKP